jgi:protein phosphatase
MGGHAMGDIASETVGNAVCDYWERFTNEDLIVKARRACRSASAKLDERSFGMNQVQMGTTLVMASIDGNRITITHCGDSRCYLMRNDDLVYQTKDHVGDSFDWEIVTKCFFSYKPEAAVPDIAQFEIKPGDRILLCSDGLYKSMPPEILKARMMDNKTPEKLLDVFDFLCEKNGDDNYTAILAIVE